MNSTATPGPEPQDTNNAARPLGVTLVAIYLFVMGGLFSFSAVSIGWILMTSDVNLSSADPNEQGWAIVLGALTGALVVGAVLLFTVALGLWRQRNWARVAALIVAGVSLLAFPFGTLVGGLSIWVLLRSETVATFR